MKKAIPFILALSLGVAVVGCSGEEPVEKAPPVSSNDKNNFQTSIDKGGSGTASEDGAPAAKSGGESAAN